MIQERTYFPKTESELLNISNLSLRWNRLKYLPKEFFNLIHSLTSTEKSFIKKRLRLNQSEDKISTKLFDLINSQNLVSDVVILKKLPSVSIKTLPHVKIYLYELSL